MDNFLHLVPMENDGDSDPGLVYGSDELVVGESTDALDAQIGEHIDHTHADAALFPPDHPLHGGLLGSDSALRMLTTEPLGGAKDLSDEHTTTGDQADEADGEDDDDDDDDDDDGSVDVDGQENQNGDDDQESDEIERMRYLKRARVLEKEMEHAAADMQHRLDSMKRILELRDPSEQLAEYVALVMEERQDEPLDIVPELLQCAKRLRSPEDVDVALLGAFMFLCETPRRRDRGLAALLPVVAAMLEATNSNSSLSLDLFK